MPMLHKTNEQHSSGYWLLYGVFVVSVGLSFIVGVVEAFEPGFFSNWLQPIWFLVIAIVCGLLLGHKSVR